MKTALLIAAVDPGIGGVLIRGQKGTGKSTAARALVPLLPRIKVVKGCAYHCNPDNPDEMDDACRARLIQHDNIDTDTAAVPFIELPLNATEDRLAGSLHIEHALETGEQQFKPGLLAAANRGILYIDEVNLLPDHLVDMILDAASSGRNVVEREGFSLSHPARFLLIGTMNPEEGELRPQFLDRFGLSVIASGLVLTDARVAIVKQRLAFEKDPRGFLEKHADEEAGLREQISQARLCLGTITVPDAMLTLAAQICSTVKVQGHRADITLVKAARSLACLLEKNEVTAAEIKAVAHYVLPHRMESARTETPEKMAEKIDQLLRTLNPDTTDDISAPGTASGKSRIDDKAADSNIDDEPVDMELMQTPGSFAAGSILFSFIKKKLKTPHSQPD